MLALAPETVDGASRRGSEIQINSFTTGVQHVPAVAADADGNFVVVWVSVGQYASSDGVFARRFSSAGVGLAAEFQVNLYTPGNQIRPAVAMAGDGDFVVVWESDLQDGSLYGVFARRFSSAGAAIGVELQVNLATSSNQRTAAVAADADGDFVVVWESYFQDASENGLFARRFSSAGSPLGGELQINSYTTGSQRSASVTADADGDFIVAWHSENQDGQSYGVFARRFSSAGTGQAVEFQVNTRTNLYQGQPSVSSNGGGGDFVIAWSSTVQDGFSGGIFARRFSSAGTALGVEFLVNGYTTNAQNRPSVVVAGDGDFVITWASDLQDGSQEGIFARTFSSAGAPLAVEFQVNTYTQNVQYDSAVALQAGGDFVVVWQSTSQDGSFEGVFAQRFGDATLDVDADGEIEPLTDGLLVLRYLFGFRGAVLIAGAVDLGDCTLCDATSIEAHIASVLPQLDADGDGEIEPLTDGLLILRYLFGFRSATLTNGAVDLGDCTRCTAPDIEAYVQTLIG